MLYSPSNQRKTRDHLAFLGSQGRGGGAPSALSHLMCSKEATSAPNDVRLFQRSNALSARHLAGHQTQVQLPKPWSRQAGGVRRTLLRPQKHHLPPQASSSVCPAEQLISSHKMSHFKVSEMNGLWMRLLTLQKNIHFTLPSPAGQLATMVSGVCRGPRFWGSI